MKRIIDFIANETDGKDYKSYKYCFEKIEVPRLEYDDKKEIRVKKNGETDKSLKTSKSLENLAVKISKKSTPLFRYFLDGSRRTYKVADIAYDKRLYPIIAGQIGVAVCKRESPDSFKSEKIKKPLVISVPERANATSSIGNSQLFFNNLISKLNKQEVLKNRNIKFSTILPYNDSPLKTSANEKYENRGIATIQDEMVVSFFHLID